MTIARVNGSNDAKRIASLEATGDSVYETFDVYYPLFFPPQIRRLCPVDAPPRQGEPRNRRSRPFEGAPNLPERIPRPSPSIFAATRVATTVGMKSESGSSLPNFGFLRANALSATGRCQSILPSLSIPGTQVSRIGTTPPSSFRTHAPLAEVPYFALIRFDDDPASDVIHPEGKPLRGGVYVPIGAEHSFTTFQFAQSIQQNRLRLVVG